MALQLQGAAQGERDEVEIDWMSVSKLWPPSSWISLMRHFKGALEFIVRDEEQPV